MTPFEHEDCTMIDDPAAGLPEPETPELVAFATLVTTAGKLVRLNAAGAGLSLVIDGRNPVVLDRFQAAAFRAALAALPEG